MSSSRLSSHFLAFTEAKLSTNAWTYILRLASPFSCWCSHENLSSVLEKSKRQTITRPCGVIEERPSRLRRWLSSKRILSSVAPPLVSSARWFNSGCLLVQCRASNEHRRTSALETKFFSANFCWFRICLDFFFSASVNRRKFFSSKLSQSRGQRINILHARDSSPSGIEAMWKKVEIAFICLFFLPSWNNIWSRESCNERKLNEN